ncbi:12764_t:CDS:2, partial [Ambispora leptoticha]
MENANDRDATEIHNELVNAVREQVLSIVTIRRWIAKYKDGEIDFDDKPRSGRPREVVQELVANDPHNITRRLEEEAGISHERIVHILHNELDLHKVCAKLIPHKLSAEHKEKRVEISKPLLEVLEQGYNNIIIWGRNMD